MPQSGARDQNLCHLSRGVYVPLRALFLVISEVMRKPVFGISNQVRHKPGCTATEDGILGSIEGLNYIVAKTKALISWAAMLICTFVVVFSHMQKKQVFRHGSYRSSL